jgi:phage shock protein PspC (stress-responsive transcriptional regulator)
MSSPYPPQPPKRLLRSTSNRIIGGVCGGVADYLNMDVNLVRILTVLISLFTGVPVILYIIALFVVPEDNSVPLSETQSSTPPPAYAPYPGAGAAGSAGSPRSTAEDAVWGTEGAPWEQRQPAAPTPESTAAPRPEATNPESTAPSEPEAPVVPPNNDEEPRA